MAIQAESHIRNAIRTLWIKFGKVGHLTNKMECVRRTEGPKLTNGAEFDVRVPESLCATKECNNANFFKSQRPALKAIVTDLEARKMAGENLTEELETALSAIKSAMNNSEKLYHYKRCLEIGDVWIHLECCVAGVKHFATTNHKESEILCPPLGLIMRLPET